MSRDSGLAVATCRRTLARGHRLGELPAVANAYDDGRLTVDQVDVLAAVATAERAALFARDEALLVDQAASLSDRDLRRVVAYWASCADDELDLAPPTVHEGRHASIVPGIDGEVELVAVLDPVGGAIVSSAIAGIVDELRRGDRDDASATTRTLPQLRADALVELATRAVATGSTPNGRVLVTVAVGGDTFGRLCELGNGQVVRPADLLPYRGRLDVNAVLFDDRRRAIVGTDRRSFTGLLRRAIEVRDLACTHPSGCAVALDRCDVDHVVPHHLHGPTSQDSGRHSCRFHNRIWNNHTATADERRRLDELRSAAALMARPVSTRAPEPSRHRAGCRRTRHADRTTGPASHVRARTMAGVGTGAVAGGGRRLAARSLHALNRRRAGTSAAIRQGWSASVR